MAFVKQDDEFDIDDAVDEIRDAAIKIAKPMLLNNEDSRLDALMVVPSVRVKAVHQLDMRRIGGRIVRLIARSRNEATTTVEIEAEYQIATGRLNIKRALSEIEGVKEESNGEK